MKMTNKNKVIQYLSNNQKPICDDCLSFELNFPQRQVANQICNALYMQGKIKRQRGTCHICEKSKLVNIKCDSMEIKNDIHRKNITRKLSEQYPWYWEGNIQSAIVSWLSQNRYKILSVANTAQRTPGKDIIAESLNGKKLWITVKGYPEKSSHTQARHWFAQAIFDLILYRDESPSVDLAMGLPDNFQTYISLSKKVNWLKKNLPFKIFWVSREGEIRKE